MVNVFVSHFSPKKAAHALPTLLLQRMCLEAVEVLCGVQWNIRLDGDKTPSRDELPDSDALPPYRRSLSQRKHPIVLWAGADRSNYIWLLKHTHALAHEHVRRYFFGDERVVEIPKPYSQCFNWLAMHRMDVPTVHKKNFVMASALDYYGAFNEPVFKEYSDDIRVQYRLSLIHKWDYLYTRKHSWHDAGPPIWYYHKPYTSIVRELFGDPTTPTAFQHRKELQDVKPRRSKEKHISRRQGR